MTDSHLNKIVKVKNQITFDYNDQATYCLIHFLQRGVRTEKLQYTLYLIKTRKEIT